MMIKNVQPLSDLAIAKQAKMTPITTANNA